VIPFLAIDFSAISGNTRAFIVAGAIVALATIVGFIVERILIAGLRRAAASTKFMFDDIIVSSVRGLARWGFFLLGVFTALPVLPIPLSMSEGITTAARLLILVLSVIVVGRFASGIAAHYAHRLLPSSVSLTKIVVNVIVMAFGLLIIFQTVGIKITPILAALGVGGLAVALALQDTLANFFSGMQILASRQIRIGDYILLDSGQEGFVSDIGWRSATMKMLNNNIVIVPNTKLAQAIVTNYSLEEPDFDVRMTIGVAYDSDLAMVERVTVEAAREVAARLDGVSKESDPVVRFREFGESSIELILVLRCHEFRAQVPLRHELVKAIHERYQQEGIEIPFPIRTVYMKGASGTD